MRRFTLVISFLVIAIMASGQAIFKGGEGALNTFLQKHIVYPEFSSRNCIGGIIYISFKVQQDGSLKEIAVQKGMGIDLDDEALRVVKLTRGMWSISSPGITEARMVLPIRFSPDNNRCISVNNITRQQAVQAYQNRQELENAVTNYYKNKYAGKADTTKEQEIIALKQQLGFDDELIGELLQKADAKQKQGDTDGACEDWNFIRNIGSNRADDFIAHYCGKQ
ncbi:TonB family protein [Mucilaginibacter yixingensis]|uniref:TonB family protein n=1 Tax=Mucilaginibacter yixingensis TaxID=1295612 RepID=A0A2T5JDH3_9SPHI|nr:energy transducer TonB [Mucilaginibacter yixingensis]PTQ99818.1 TonB family protein [Mucilaginibacter yixingensis]